MKLFYHPYKYFPYEKQLAIREVEALLGKQKVAETADGIELLQPAKYKDAERLVYFSHIQMNEIIKQTGQSLLERDSNVRSKRQSTRYSVHGLHEYKGKFNPQVAKAILNIFGVKPGQKVLDPFCGSGTTIVECAHLGATGVGLDINPLAVFVVNAKLLALRTPSAKMNKAFSSIKATIGPYGAGHLITDQNARHIYLSKWFSPDILLEIEQVRMAIETSTVELSPIFLSIASNLLREYSLQDPIDLRIRRRKSPLPNLRFRIAFEKACENFITTVEHARTVIRRVTTASFAELRSSTVEAELLPQDELFDAAITSPPYAMALPYIDTQRLSLVWLELVEPDQILKLEAELIGSREMRAGARRQLPEALNNNSYQIPSAEHKLCLELQNKIGPADGFRRIAVPILLYRYFSEMQKTFQTTRAKMKTNAPFGLIIGHNHTTLGGVRQDINTPHHLASIASESGWTVNELIDLQTYQRYGLHSNNAVSSETLLVLRAS